MRTRPALGPAVLLGCAALALSGCTPAEDPVDEPTPTVDPTPEPTEEPAPEPEEPTEPPPEDDGRPELADLVVSPAGLGPLEIGVPPEDNPGSEMIVWDPEACADLVPAGEPAGRWTADGYPEDESYSGDLVVPFRLLADDDGVHWIDVLGATPRTAEGTGIGTTVEEMQAAHGDLQGPFDGPVSRVWWVEGEAGTLVLETQGDADGLRPAGTPESVILVRVLAAGNDPQFATANTGHVADSC